MKLKLGFLASHQGSNMQAIIDACLEGRLAAEPCVVISNNRNAEALQRAQKAGVPAYHMNSKTHPDPNALDLAIVDVLRRHGVNLLILAGYMRKVGPQTLREFWSRILNIHPALLPKFGGQGMYGMHVHEAVIRSGDRETGITIHVVDEEYDQGPIVSQCRIPVEPGDTPESLRERVLAREHEFFVETLVKIASGDIVMP